MYCLIWSEEHGAWWGPGKSGYTRSIFKAGHYTESEAAEIVDKANAYAEGKIKEVALRVGMEADGF